MRPVRMSPSPTPGNACAMAIPLRRLFAVACRAAPRVFRSRLTPRPTVAVSLGTLIVAFAVTATVRPVAGLAAAGGSGPASSATVARAREIFIFGVMSMPLLRPSDGFITASVGRGAPLEQFEDDVD